MKTLATLRAFILLMLFSIQLQGQDLNFSQFYELPGLRNPALAGIIKGDFRAVAIHRSQWQQMIGQYQTSGLGLETKSSVREYSDDYYSFGLIVTNDEAGDASFGKTQFLPSFTFHKFLREEGNLYLSAGFSGGAVQQRFDPSKLRFDDQFVNGSYSSTNATRQAFTNTNITYFDATAGIALGGELGYRYRFYIGAAYSHFHQPKVAFFPSGDVRLNKKITISGGLSAAVSDYSELYSYFDFFTQGGTNMVQGGFLFTHNLLEEVEDPTYRISIGSFYRWGDAIIPVIKLDYTKLSFGFTYDVNISNLSAASRYRGGAEVSVSYKTYLNNRKSSALKMRCPVF
jgi:type IX secretion system PorP/SprF family membrane protein